MWTWRNLSNNKVRNEVVQQQRSLSSVWRHAQWSEAVFAKPSGLPLWVRKWFIKQKDSTMLLISNFAGFSYSLAGILYSSSLILTSLSILVGIHVHPPCHQLSTLAHFFLQFSRSVCETAKLVPIENSPLYSILWRQICMCNSPEYFQRVLDGRLRFPWHICFSKMLHHHGTAY